MKMYDKIEEHLQKRVANLSWACARHLILNEGAGMRRNIGRTISKTVKRKVSSRIFVSVTRSRTAIAGCLYNRLEIPANISRSVLISLKN